MADRLSYRDGKNPAPGGSPSLPNPHGRGVLERFNRVVLHLERKRKLDKVFGGDGEGCPDPDPNPMPTRLESNVHNNL